MTKIPLILKQHESDLLTEWLARQRSTAGPRGRTKPEGELREQSGGFLNLLQEATQSGNLATTEGAGWTPVREYLQRLSAERARQGFSPIETATFIFSLKEPL